MSTKRLGTAPVFDERYDGGLVGSTRSPSARPDQALADRHLSQASLKALRGLGRHFDVSIGVGYVGLPNLSDSTSPMSGMASTFGVGLRLKRPHDQRSFGGASPFVDAEALSVQGGLGDHRALAVGAGLAFPIGRERGIWLGPFLRHIQLIEPTGAGLDKRASGGLFAGVTFEVGSPARTAVERGVTR